MSEIRLKYLFFALSISLLALMLLISSDAGITCDEVLHYDHSVKVVDYFKTHGADRSALNTPVTNLRYYGQSYDNLTTILAGILKIDDIYRFRHIMSPVAGWLTILTTALLAVWLAGYRAGLITLLLFAASPTFIGHSQNNLKDIPFALGYIAATFAILKFLSSGRKVPVSALLLLVFGVAFSISIRAGGLLTICYMFLFFAVWHGWNWMKKGQIDPAQIRDRLLIMAAVTVISWGLGILLWPYALQAPVRNVLASYRVMAHFPDTFRQIFEGRVEWSDFMPWYYIPKSMVITIPLIVLTGLALFLVFIRKAAKSGKGLLYGFILFTILFPMAFVVYEKSNLYSSWRQFLFLYPPVVLLAATGFHFSLDLFRGKYLKPAAVSLFIILMINPAGFMIRNHKYAYLYYNQLVGGVKGAYGNYETDYYYVSQTEASEWLINYLDSAGVVGPLKVKATYPVKWQFRKHPGIETSYMRYEERSMNDWDYAIVANRYITPYQLKNKQWPPSDAIHVIYAEGMPIGAVLKRKTKDDLLACNALEEGDYRDAIRLYEQALETDDGDEMIFYNFAAALYSDGQYLRADSALNRALELNPDSDMILMYLGNIAKSKGRIGEAIGYYEKVISSNRKYFDGYVALSELVAREDVERARDLLRECLELNPRFRPAIKAMADTYRESDPGVARKYDELASTIK